MEVLLVFQDNLLLERVVYVGRCEVGGGLFLLEF
jgi:hypothetical protein